MSKNYTIKSCRFLKSLLFLAMLCCCGVYAQNGAYILGYQSNNTIGLPTLEDAHAVTPFTIGAKDARSQYLYLKDELIDSGASAGTITAISFQVTKIPTVSIPVANFTIKIGTTTATTLGSTLPAPNTYPIYKTVNSLSITQLGWLQIDLDTDFIWNGVDNIIIEICKTDTNNTPSSYEIQATRFPSGDNRTIGIRTRINFNPVVNTGCDMQVAHSTQNAIAISSSDRRVRPDIKFTFACTGTPAPGTTISKTTTSVCYGETIALKIVGDSEASRITYQWESSPVSPLNFTTIAGEVNAEITITKDVVDKYYRRRTICGPSSGNSFALLVEGVNSWNGSSWSKGVAPLSHESAVFNGNYTFNSDMEFCTMFVNSGVITVASGKTLKVANEIRVNGGTLVFEDSANLIQSNEFTNNSGNIIYKRNSQPVRRFDYTYWSSPVQSQTLVGFSPQTLSDKYFSWNHNTQAWSMESPSNTMNVGKGYIIRAPQTFATTGSGSVFSGSFIGKPNNGTITTPVSGNGTWNLIGNPYPSAIDAVSFLMNSTNQNTLDATLYYWTHNTSPSQIPGDAIYNYTAADYATYNFTGGVGTGTAATTIGNIQEPTRFIGAGQSFMVKGINSGGNAVFSNSMRTSSNNSQFFRNTSLTQSTIATDFERHRFWLELTNQQSVFKQILIGYIDGATEGMDRGFDGQTLESTSFSFFSLINNNQKLTIQGKGLPFNENDTVSLGFHASVAGNHVLSLYQYDGLFDTQNIYVEDTYTNTIHDLKESNYEFVAPIGTFLDRFVVRYTNGILNTNDPILTNNALYAFKKNNQINIHSTKNEMLAIRILDISGRVLMEKENINEFEISIPTSHWGKQILLIEITNNDRNNKEIIKIIN